MGLTVTRRWNEKIYIDHDDIKIDVVLIRSDINYAQIFLESSNPICVKKDGKVRDACEVIPCGWGEKIHISSKNEEILLSVICVNDYRAKIDVAASKKVLIRRDNLRKDT